ncbi:MAG: metallophosphoesterase family protein [Paludibacter sp.]
MKKSLVFFLIIFLQFQYVVLATEPFRFAFFTDLHINTSNQVPSDDLLLAVKEVNENKDIEFILVGGDITQNGDTNSLKDAKKILQTLKKPFYIVPGNHDFRWNIKNGTTDFNQIFGDNKFSFTHKRIQFKGFTTVPLNKTGNASIQPDDLKWMSVQLKKAGKKTPIFVVTHYPLQTGDVDNWNDMTDILKKYNVVAVVNGHYHRNVCLNYDGIPGIVNRSTLRAKNTVGGYSIYTVNDSIHVFEKRIGEPEELWLSLPYNKAK